MSRIALTPDTATILTGKTRTFAAQPMDADGKVLAGLTVEWSVSDPTVASVVAGVVTALKPGTATVSAKNGSIAGTATVTVIPAVAEVRVRPSPDTVIVARTTQLTATLLDAAGGVITGRTITWSSSSDAVASVSPTGLVTANAVGTATVIAAAEEKTASATIVVRPVPAGPVGSVVVAPAAVTVVAGKDTALGVTLLDAAGQPLTGRAVAWASSDESKARVSQTGVVTGVSLGSAAITATSEGKVGSATVSVADLSAPSFAGLAATPATVDVTGASQTVTVTAQLADPGGAGVARFDVTLVSTARASAVASCRATAPAAGGTAANGSWSCAVTIPANAPAGDWLLFVTAADAALNRRALGPNDLAAAGFPAKIQVTSSHPDTEAPVLAGLTVTPATVNVSAGARTVVVEAQLSDVGSGVARFDAVATTPNDQSVRVGCSPAAVRVSGTPANGTWQCTLTIPMAARPGDWALSLGIADAAFNAGSVSSADLAANGLPSKITVESSSPDVTLPSFASLVLSSSTADVRMGAQVITATAHLIDAGGSGGVVLFEFSARAPDGTIVSCSSNGQPTPDGSWSCPITIPPGAASGDWVISVQAADAALNRRVLNQAELAAAGFPTRIVVTGK